MSQRDAILAALQRGDRLTQLDALQRFGCSRLAARIAEIKKLGHPVVMRWVSKGKKTFAEYYLPETCNAVEIDGVIHYRLPL